MIRTFVFIFAIVSNLLLADAVTKELAFAHLKGAKAISVIPGFFNLAYVENRGCAWGMLQNQVWLLAVIGVVALGLLIWQRREIFPNKLTECLLYAGILGNLIDRVYRGYVIDFLDFYMGTAHFPCFNLADTYITIAAGLLLMHSFVSSRRKTA